MDDECDQREIQRCETRAPREIGKHGADDDCEWKYERSQLRCNTGLRISRPEEIRADGDQAEKPLALSK
jgi:hypothetical protein